MKKTIVILLALTTSAFAAKPQLPRLGLKSFDGWNKSFVTVRGTDKATVVSNAVATIEQMEAGNASSAQLKELAKFLKQGSCKSLTYSGKFEKEVLERKGSVAMSQETEAIAHECYRE